MKTCPVCHQVIDADAKICPNCHSPLETDETSIALNSKKSDDQINSRQKQKRENKKSWFTRFAHYFRYLYLHIRNPFPSEAYPETKQESYGLISLLLISIFNTLSFTSIATYLIENYEWLANISILPNLSFTFNPLLFGAQTFILSLVSFWLLTALIQFLNNKVFHLGFTNKFWLTQFFGMNSLALIFAFIGFILSIFAPILFLVITAFLLILQFITFIVTATMHILSLDNRTRISGFYWLIILFSMYFIIEMILITLIY